MNTGFVLAFGYCESSCSEPGAHIPAESPVSVLLGMYPDVEILDHVVFLSWIFWRCAILFSTAAAPFYCPISNALGFQCLHILTVTLFCFFLVIAIVIGVKGYLTELFICISLITNNIEPLFIYLLAIFVSFWRNVYSNLLLIFGGHLGFFVVVVKLYEFFIYSCY